MHSAREIKMCVQFIWYLPIYNGRQRHYLVDAGWNLWWMREIDLDSPSSQLNVFDVAQNSVFSLNAFIQFWSKSPPAMYRRIEMECLGNHCAAACSRLIFFSIGTAVNKIFLFLTVSISTLQLLASWKHLQSLQRTINYYKYWALHLQLFESIIILLSGFCWDWDVWRVGEDHDSRAWMIKKQR